MHPVSSPVFDSPQGSPLPPIPPVEMELQHLIKERGDEDYLNKNEFVFSGLPNGRPRNQGAETADLKDGSNHKTSESSGIISDEDDFFGEREHLMKDYDNEKDVCETNSGVFETPLPYVNTRPYTNVNNFIKNYGSDGATSKKEDDFPATTAFCKICIT